MPINCLALVEQCTGLISFSSSYLGALTLKSDPSPTRRAMAKLAKHQNALGQRFRLFARAFKQSPRYSSLGSEVFFAEFGSDWTSYRSARNRRRIDFSGPKWSLETLAGPESGLMHKQFIREHIDARSSSKLYMLFYDCYYYYLY